MCPHVSTSLFSFLSISECRADIVRQTDISPCCHFRELSLICFIKKFPELMAPGVVPDSLNGIRQ